MRHSPDGWVESGWSSSTRRLPGWSKCAGVNDVLFAGSSPYVKPFRIRVGAAVMAEVEEGNGADEPSTLPQSDDIQLPSSSSCAVDALTVDSDDDEDFPAYEVLESEKHVELVGRTVYELSLPTFCTILLSNWAIFKASLELLK